MRFYFSFIVMLTFFTGCATTAPEPYQPSTYNVSSAKTKTTNTKSTTTYPGSGNTYHATQQPSEVVQNNAPVIDSTITSTNLAMATPTPSSSLEEPSQPGQDMVASDQEAPLQVGSMSLASPMPKPLNNDSTMIKIAVLIPQKTIKKYAISTVNSVLSYLLYKNYYFDLNVFNSGDEKEDSITKALADIKAGGYQYIIAPVTNEGAAIIASHVQDTLVFIPTIHHSALPSAGSNIIFGGIDYNQQIALLSEKANESVGTFEDGSSLSYQLNGIIKQHSNRVFFEKRIEGSKTNFRGMFKGNSSLNNASLYLNTPLVTTSLIASQLRANNITANALLSTQINYNPLLLTLTQYEDRSRMYIANSIQRAPTGLEEINAMFGHDIVYDWVNYATSIGADYACSNFFEGQVPRLFKENVANNQIIYNTSLYQPDRYSFKRMMP